MSTIIDEEDEEIREIKNEMERRKEKEERHSSFPDAESWLRKCEKDNARRWEVDEGKLSIFQLEERNRSACHELGRMQIPFSDSHREKREKKSQWTRAPTGMEEFGLALITSQ